MEDAGASEEWAARHPGGPAISLAGRMPWPAQRSHQEDDLVAIGHHRCRAHRYWHGN